MIQGWIRPVLLAFAGLATANCASHYTTSGAAVGYNRSFADARNEVILLNVLRASVSEPLQFSTMSTVQGSAHNSTSIAIPFTNIIAGGIDAISPTVTLGPRNPNATVTPLESREFIVGILRSVSVETIGNLITQGHPRATVLSLAIGGVQCDAGSGATRNIINFGPPDAQDAQFRRALLSSTAFTAEPMDGSVRPLRLPAADALKLLREGAGSGRDVRLREKLEPGEAPPQANEIDLSVVEVSSTARGVMIQEEFPDCDPRTGKGNSRSWGLIPRSVHSMYRYLGRYHAHNMQQSSGACRNEEEDQGLEVAAAGLTPLIRIRAMCRGLGAPVSAAVSTTFRGRTYYVLRSDTETLEAMSILSALTALQTSESSLAASRPIIALTPQ